nr:hypothetical protein [Tanacetum cinerariifolium]
MQLLKVIFTMWVYRERITKATRYPSLYHYSYIPEQVIFIEETEDDAFSFTEIEDDVISIFDDDSQDDAFFVTMTEDDDNEDDDEDYEVSKVKGKHGTRNKNASEVKRPNSAINRPKSDERIIDCILGLRAPKSNVECSNSKRVK